MASFEKAVLIWCVLLYFNTGERWKDDLFTKLVKPNNPEYIGVHIQAWHSGIGEVITTEEGTTHSYHIDDFLAVKQSFVRNYLRLRIKCSHILYLKHVLEAFHAETDVSFLIEMRYCSCTARFHSSDKLFDTVLEFISVNFTEQNARRTLTLTLFFENQDGSFLSLFRECTVLSKKQVI